MPRMPLRRAALADGRNLDLEIIGARYERVDRMVGQAVRPPDQPLPRWTDRIDAVLTHRVAGIVVFALVMLALFQALFSWSEPAIALIERVVALGAGRRRARWCRQGRCAICWSTASSPASAT